jgi:hypothetical protein
MEVRSIEIGRSSVRITITVENVASASEVEPGTFFSRLARKLIGRPVRNLIHSIADRLDAPLEPGELPQQVAVLSHYQEALKAFPAEPELARALDIPADELARWKKGVLPGDREFRRLRDLAMVISRLLEYYDPRVVPDWLYGENPDLGGRQPITVLRDGGLAEVLSVVDAQTSGSYI